MKRNTKGVVAYYALKRYQLHQTKQKVFLNNPVIIHVDSLFVNVVTVYYTRRQSVC